MADKVIRLIEKLIKDTADGIYKWECLDECIKENCNLINVPLKNFVISNNKSHYKKGYNKKIKLKKIYGYSNSHYIHYPFSFSLNIEGGVVTLLTFSDDNGEHYYKLFLQNTPLNDVFAINLKEEYQEELRNLLKLIKDKRDNVDNLIEKIIGKD